MRRREFLAAGAATTLPLAAPRLSRAAEPLKIGLILPMTGPFASTGRQIEAAVRLYMQQNGSEVAGRPVEVIVRDDANVADATRRHAQELVVNDKAAVLAGFGLTPLEAMAAGLPCVVSDWDGYRDTVRHGVDGFRIRTLTPRPGLGADLAYAYAQRVMGYEAYAGGGLQGAFGAVSGILGSGIKNGAGATIQGIGEIATIPTAPAVAGAYYHFDKIFRTQLPLGNTKYSANY